MSLQLPFLFSRLASPERFFSSSEAQNALLRGSTALVFTLGCFLFLEDERMLIPPKCSSLRGPAASFSLLLIFAGYVRGSSPLLLFKSEKFGTVLLNRIQRASLPPPPHRAPSCFSFFSHSSGQEFLPSFFCRGRDHDDELLSEREMRKRP